MPSKNRKYSGGFFGLFEKPKPKPEAQSAQTQSAQTQSAQTQAAEDQSSETQSAEAQSSEARQPETTKPSTTYTTKQSEPKKEGIMGWFFSSKKPDANQIKNNDVSQTKGGIRRRRSKKRKTTKRTKTRRHRKK